MSNYMINAADNEMPLAGSEMPPGNMTDSTENFSDQKPLSGVEMPTGSMSAATDDFTDQMPPPSDNLGGGEMPGGNMTDNPPPSGSAQAVSGAGEMPTGNMSGDTTASAKEQDKQKIIEIPGSWKLHLTYVSE
jgi:hypothetical protein